MRVVYQILQESYREKLERSVNELLADGWKLRGPLIITQLVAPYDDILYTQVMIFRSYVE